MRMKIGLVVIAVMIIVAGSFRIIVHLNKEDDVNKVVVTPVAVDVIEATEIEDVLAYDGRIMPLSIERISFKSTARLESFGGEVGQTLDAGVTLASLELDDLHMAKEAAENQLIAATADYNRANKGTRAEDLSLAALSVDKANNAVDYLTNRYEDILTLQAEGVVSQAEAEGLKLELDLAQSDYALAKKTYEKALNGAEEEMVEAAKAQVALADTNLQVQTSMLEDAVYVLEASKVIVDQLYEPGELVPAGYPVAIVRSVEQSVTIGVTRKDLNRITIGQNVHVNGTDLMVEGKVARIAEVPDQTHFLYEVEISLPDGDYVVGDIVRCELVLGSRQVVKVPVTAIMNDGIDYVYEVVDGAVSIVQVQVEDMVDGYVIVQGLEPGTQMIVNNLNRIGVRSLVEVEETIE